MRRVLLGSILITLLSLIVASGAFAGELEDQMLKAVYDGDVEAVRSLIDRGADVNARDEGGVTVFDNAYEIATISCALSSEAYCNNGLLILDMLEAAGAKGDLYE